MGGTGFNDIVKTVVGIGGLVGSTTSALSQTKYMNQLLNQGEDQRGLVKGIDKYFLGGGRARKLNVPGFQDQFAEIDYAVQEQLRNLDSQSSKARQQIEDTIPSGGAKMRALADLAVQTQDVRGKVLREAQSTKRDLDVKLTNEYLQAAMGRNVGMSYDSKMYAALQDYGARQKDIASIGTVLGSMSKRDDNASPRLEYTYTSPGDVSGKATDAAASWAPGAELLDTEQSEQGKVLKPWEKKIKTGLSVGQFSY